MHVDHVEESQGSDHLEDHEESVNLAQETPAQEESVNLAECRPIGEPLDQTILVELPRMR